MRDGEIKSKVVIRNMIWGIFNQVVNILLPFILRTIIIYWFGVNYIGLRTLFSSILNVLNVAELGFGGVISTLLYAPVAENNHEKIVQLVRFLKRCYLLLGSIIFVLGLMLLPFLDKLIALDYPEEMNIYILYLINLFGTVAGYFLFAYKKILLSANQRYDIEVNIATIMIFLQTTIQVVVVIVTKNFYLFMMAVPICTVLNNLISNCIVNKLYPLSVVNVKALCNDDKKRIYQKVQGAFYYRIGSVMLFSADNIVISKFLGLIQLGVYNNYYYIVNSLQGIQAIIHNSIRPIIGNMICKKSVTENQKEFFDYYFCYMGISIVCGAGVLCLGQSFVELWIGEDMKLPFGICVMLTIDFMAQSICDIFRIYQEAAGIFKEGRYVPLCGAAVNLILNLLLTRYFGLYGIVLSTILAVLIVLLPGYVSIVWKYYFKNAAFIKYSIANILLYAFSATLILVITKYVCDKISVQTWGDLMIRGTVCVLISIVLYAALLGWKTETKDVLSVLKRLKGN